jgi:hypothetical protein
MPWRAEPGIITRVTSKTIKVSAATRDRLKAHAARRGVTLGNT